MPNRHQAPCLLLVLIGLAAGAPLTSAVVVTRIEARLQDNHQIDLQLTGTDGGLSILLNRGLVDLDRPIEIRVDRRRIFRGLAQPSLSALAESIAWHFDPAMVFTHRIDL